MAVRGSSLTGSRSALFVIGFGKVALWVVPFKKNPASYTVTGKALRFVISMAIAKVSGPPIGIA